MRNGGGRRGVGEGGGGNITGMSKGRRTRGGRGRGMERGRKGTRRGKIRGRW